MRPPLGESAHFSLEVLAVDGNEPVDPPVEVLDDYWEDPFTTLHDWHPLDHIEQPAATTPFGEAVPWQEIHMTIGPSPRDVHPTNDIPDR